MSLFKPFQEIKIQETADQVPQGNVPRQFTAYVRGDNCRQCAPGDIVEIQGILLPSYEETFTGLRTLLMNTFIEVQSITRIKKKYIEFMPSEEVIAKIQQERQKQSSKQIYDKLSGSIAPQIFGLDDVKKSLLLQMGTLSFIPPRWPCQAPSPRAPALLTAFAKGSSLSLRSACAGRQCAPEHRFHFFLFLLLLLPLHIIFQDQRTHHLYSDCANCSQWAVTNCKGMTGTKSEETSTSLSSVTLLSRNRSF